MAVPKPWEKPKPWETGEPRPSKLPVRRHELPNEIWEDARYTVRQRRFVEEYCKHFNAFRAARDAGYAGTSLPSLPSRLLAEPKIRRAIDRWLTALSMSAAEVLKRLTDVARFEPGSILELDEYGRPVVDPVKLMESKRFISKYYVDANGNPRIEYHDGMAALLQLGRAHRLFTDKQELSGPGGGPIPVAVLVKFVGEDGTDP